LLAPAPFFGCQRSIPFDVVDRIDLTLEVYFLFRQQGPSCIRLHENLLDTIIRHDV